MERKKVRLQKVVARGGVSSRRAAERIIAEGRVRVNGRVVTELGTTVDPRSDRVEVDGRRLVAEKPLYLVLHKPRGMVSTIRDPEGRASIGDLATRIGMRIFPVGRLDYHTSGVLLLTNDGEFCDGLLHPRRDVPKTYVVKVAGEMTERDRSRWEQGVELDDGKTRPANVKILRHEGGKTWLEVTLFEGRNQQIRRMGEATGFPVMRLARTSFAGIDSEGLRPGALRDLSVTELQKLKQEYGVPRQVPKQSAVGRPLLPEEVRSAARPRQSGHHPETQPERERRRDLRRQDTAGRDRTQRQDPARRDRTQRQDPARRARTQGQDPARRARTQGQDPARRDRTQRQDPARRDRRQRQDTAGRDRTQRQDPARQGAGRFDRKRSYDAERSPQTRDQRPRPSKHIGADSTAGKDFRSAANVGLDRHEEQAPRRSQPRKRKPFQSGPRGSA